MEQFFSRLYFATHLEQLQSSFLYKKLHGPDIRKKGFTLVEILIVIAIMSVLATVLMTALNPLEQIKKANDAKRKVHLEQMQRALEIYYNDYDRYPASSSDFKIVAGGQPLNWGSSWQPYIASLPKDPSQGHSYIYYASPDGQSYYLYTNLERANKDPQSCGTAGCSSLTSGSAGFPAPTSCGATCNFGVSSPNAVVHNIAFNPSSAPLPTTSIPTSAPAPTTSTPTSIPTAVPPTSAPTTIPPTPTRTPTPLPPTPTRTPTPIPPTPTPGPVAFRAVVNNTTGGTASSLTINKPTGTITSDLLLAVITVRNATNVITPPSGWTLMDSIATGGSIKQSVYYRIATSSEPTSYRWNFSITEQATGAILTYANVNTTTPLDGFSKRYNDAQGSTLTATSITTTTPRDMLVFVAGITLNTTANPPSGMTERVDRNNGTGTGTTTIVAEQFLNTAGATGNKTGTAAATGAYSSLTFLLALRGQ